VFNIFKKKEFFMDVSLKYLLIQEICRYYPSSKDKFEKMEIKQLYAILAAIKKRIAETKSQLKIWR